MPDTPMSHAVALRGYCTIDELRQSPGYPPGKRLSRGPVAVLECLQEIPCNPCEASCGRGAISVGQPITNIPVLDSEKCIGCGLCVPACPGLAIFIVDMTYSWDEATVAFPYEYWPLPSMGDVVEAVDRRGNTVCPARVVRVLETAKSDHTAVVTISVPKAHADSVRSMARVKAQSTSSLSDDLLICRCEEITVSEIRRAIAQGATDLSGVRRRTRAGMGLCQGRTCESLVARILAQEAKKPVSSVEPGSARPPITPTPFSVVAGERHEQ